MKVEVSDAQPAAVDADLLVVGLFEGDRLPAGLAAAPGAADAKAGNKKLTTLLPERPGRVLAVGLGRREEMDAERARVAAAMAVQHAARVEAGTAAWLLPD